MTLEIIPVGGFLEIGRNCVVVKADDEAVMLDLGLHLDNYIAYTEEREGIHQSKDTSGASLIRAGAVPNINTVKDLWKNIKAVCITHAHLDHVGAVPFLSNKFDAPIHGAKYTIEVLRAIVNDEKISLKNDLVSHPTNSKFRVSDNIEIEFINITHSVPHTVVIVVHTKYGKVVYANDYKLDNSPTIGEKPNLKRLKQLGEEGVKILISNCLYADSSMKTPSESIAKEMLKDILLSVDSTGKALVVTTFSSHIARLRTILSLAYKLKRKPVFIGRSLNKYISAAERAGLIDFSEHAEFVRFGGQVKKFLSKIKKPDDYLLIVTGHQGEPKAVLPRMVYKEMFKFEEEDQVIFSCGVIPVEANIQNREKLDNELKRRKVRLFTKVHVSGHASREDIRDVLHMLKAEFIIPVHGNLKKSKALKELAEEIGYDGKKVVILKNDQRASF